MQTVYQGRCHVESPIRNTLKRTPFIALGQNQGICEVRSQRHCQRVCVCVCVLCFPSLPSHVSTVYIVMYINCCPNAQAKNSEVKQYQHEVIASLHLSAMPPKLFQYCEQLSLLLLRPNLHFLHAYYMLKRHTCMPQRYNSP